MVIQDLCEFVFDDLEAAVVAIESPVEIVVMDNNRVITQIKIHIECIDWETLGKAHQKNRKLEITCLDVVESTMSVGPFEHVSYQTNHPLLYKYNFPCWDLSFHEAITDPYPVLGRLVEAHHHIYQKWRPIDENLNQNIVGVLKGGHGLIARGPEPVIKAYASAISSEINLKQLEHSKGVNDFKLLLLGAGFIICKKCLVTESTII